MQKSQAQKIIAVDFDGTLCKNAYPDIGAPIHHSIHYIKKLAANGATLILHTCRCGASLDAAVAWCKERGIIFDYINENTPENIKRYGDVRKIYADIYIDANAVNPLRSAGIGENDENVEIYERAEVLAERDLCDVKCVCPEWRAAGMCCSCDVFFSLRDYHAEQILHAEAAAGELPAPPTGGAKCQDTKK